MIPIRPCVVAVLATLPIVPGRCTSQTGIRVPGRSISELLAIQVSADVGLRTGSLEVQAFPEAVHLETLAALSDSIQLLRAVSSAAGHAPPLLIASARGNTLWRLGGFIAPELIALSRALPASVQSVDVAWKRARLFAQLADPNGASELVWPVDSVRQPNPRTAEGPISRWKKSMPRDWPADGHTCTESVCAVQLTVLSKIEWGGYGARWEPVAYRFVFARDGEVIAWSRHSGEPLPE
jgi:hypothetical protein